MTRLATTFPSDLQSDQQAKRGLKWSGLLLAAATFFIIAFPKGGVKIFEIPITFGYMMTTLLLLVAMLRAHHLSISMDRFIAYLMCSFLGIWGVFVVTINGTDSVGFTIAYFVSVFYLPLFGLVFFSPLVLDEFETDIEHAIVWAVRFIVIYGIFLFFFKQFTGSWIEVPYLTVNADDVGELDDKYINRGGIFKLISTYNNGNIFGVSLAIMAPLYLRLESWKILKWAMYGAMFLTLSRTVWIGLILVLLTFTLSKGLRPLVLLYLTAGLMVVSAVIFGLLDFLGRDLSFIFDANLGGRARQLNTFQDLQFMPQVPTDALPEIVYAGVLKFFGIPGLIFFVVHLIAAPVMMMAEGTRFLSLSKGSACVQGLLIYAVIAAADAAFSYIPVIMIFWMIGGLGFWYTHQAARAARGGRAAAD